LKSLAQRARTQRRTIATAERPQQRAVARNALHRSVADVAARLLVVDPPGHAGERFSTHPSGGSGWVLTRRLYAGATRKRRDREHQDGGRSAQHDASIGCVA